MLKSEAQTIKELAVSLKTTVEAGLMTTEEIAEALGLIAILIEPYIIQERQQDEEHQKILKDLQEMGSYTSEDGGITIH